MPWLAQLDLQYTVRAARTCVHFRHDGPLRVLRSLYPEGDAVCRVVVAADGKNGQSPRRKLGEEPVQQPHRLGGRHGLVGQQRDLAFDARIHHHVAIGDGGHGARYSLDIGIGEVQRDRLARSQTGSGIRLSALGLSMNRC